MELVWALIKRKVSRQLRPTKAALRANLEAALESLQETTKQMQAFFQETDCRYIFGSSA